MLDRQHKAGRFLLVEVHADFVVQAIRTGDSATFVTPSVHAKLPVPDEDRKLFRVRLNEVGREEIAAHSVRKC